MSDRKLKIVKEFLGSFYKSKDEFLFHCPKCKHHKKKLSLNFDKNVFKCWICDYVGKDIGRLIYSYGNSDTKSQWRTLTGVVDFSEVDEAEDEKIVVKLPEEFISLTSKQVNPLSIMVRQYLKSRGLTRDDLVWWKMGYCPDGEYGKRIIIPSFDINGEVNYFIARSYTSGDWQRYKNPPAERDFIFNELYLDWNKDITIVEGVFDAIVAGNAIPLLGSTLRENSYIFQKIIANCDKVYIALDDDAKSKEFKISDLFRLYGVDVYRIDTSGFGDVGEMDKKTFQTRKKTAAFLSLDNYLLEKFSLQ
jgi:DNA primase